MKECPSVPVGGRFYSYPETSFQRLSAERVPSTADSPTTTTAPVSKSCDIGLPSIRASAVECSAVECGAVECSPVPVWSSVCSGASRVSSGPVRVQE